MTPAEQQQLHQMSDHDLLITLHTKFDDWKESCQERHAQDTQTEKRISDLETDVAHLNRVGRWIAGGSIGAFLTSLGALLKMVGSK